MHFCRSKYQTNSNVRIRGEHLWNEASIVSVAQSVSAFGCYVVNMQWPKGWWFEPTQGRTYSFTSHLLPHWVRTLCIAIVILRSVVVIRSDYHMKSDSHVATSYASTSSMTCSKNKNTFHGSVSSYTLISSQDKAMSLPHWPSSPLLGSLPPQYSLLTPLYEPLATNELLEEDADWVSSTRSFSNCCS